MTLAKLELLNKELQLTATFFEALSHQAWLTLLKYLLVTMVCMTGDIGQELPLGPTTVNQHLKELKITGLDFIEEMVFKARQNLANTGFKNIEFVQGDIEEMPLSESTFDVIISNCVLNLVPDKQKAFSEIYRVLKPDGHFCISDVVISGNLPQKLKEAAENVRRLCFRGHRKTRIFENH